MTRVIKKLMFLPGLLSVMALIINTAAFAESYTYDDIGRLTGVIYDDGSSIAYTYDAAGNRLQKTTSPPAPNISVSPLIYDLSSVVIGNISSGTTITINNTGPLNLVISSIATTGGNTAEFGVTTGTCANLTPTITAASSCTVSVTFSPTSVGAKTTTLRIASDDADTPTLDITLNGTGTPIPVADISVTPVPTDFGSIVEGDTSTVQTFTVSNIGTANLIVSTMGFTGTDAADFSVIAGTCANLAPTIAPGANCTVDVSFTPAIAGAKTASLDIASNDPDTATVSLTLTGTGVVNDNPAPFALVYPADGATGIETSFNFIWEESVDPNGHPVSYELIYCEDIALTTGCIQEPVAMNAVMVFAGLGGSLGGLMLLGIQTSGTARTRRRDKRLRKILGASLLVTLVSCGGSSGGGGSTIPSAGLGEIDHSVAGLKANTTYFWKVTADDGKGGTTESVIGSFTTR